jgi:hypothetical protein
VRATLFAQPLSPVGRTHLDENRKLGKLLLDYDTALRHGDRDAVQGPASGTYACPSDFARRHVGRGEGSGTRGNAGRGGRGHPV